MILLARVMKTISLTQLLSSCMDASRHGCEIIQNFQKGGAVTGTLKEGGEIKSVVTQADIDAQARIIGGLRRAWGDDLRIIGEEDEEDAKPNMDGPELSKTLLAELDSTLVDEDIPIEDITLFVDPLDGTREFVEGRLQNVACLIGIARKNRPIAGILGLPFPEGSMEEPVRVHYAVGDQTGSAGCWPFQNNNTTKSAETKRVTILTGDSTDAILLNATACAKSLVNNPDHVLVGGTAAKLRIVATDPNCLAILHFKTMLWDTCSPQALIESRGGKITDLFGAPLVHSPDRPFGNIFGVVASSGGPEVSKLHEELCAKMRSDTEAVHKTFGKWMGPSVPSSPQAIDVARDLDGIPFSTNEIEREVLGKELGNGATLKSYSVPESGAWRGMMSTGCRFLLEWDKRDPPKSVFYKRIVMADLAHARDKLKNAPHKLIRDVKSYQVETTFLTSKACERLIRDTGIHINCVYGSDLRPMGEQSGPKEQLESRFSILLEDFDSADGWEQQWLLNEEGTRAALETLAILHAYFWTGSNFWKGDGKLGDELEAAVWQNGGYMQPKLQGLDQLGEVAKGWEQRYPTFMDDLADIPELEGADLEKLGARLEKIADIVGEEAHPFGTVENRYEKYRTLIHGDPKQANLFFRKKEDDGVQVGLIDFQWSGFGLAATDVAHHLSAAVLPSCLSYDGQKETDLLDYYYDHLSKRLVEFGVATSVQQVQSDVFPRAVLQRQYEIALLDICRMVYAYAWRRWKLETQPTPESLNRNAYNKSLGSALWLVSRCHVLLNSHEYDLSGVPKS